MKRQRIDFIRPYIEGKSVLDCGVVQGDLEKTVSPNWLHARIKEAAAEAEGIDIMAREIEILKKRGYCVQVGDVQNMELGRKFDVIVAGELIEHLPNPGLFLNSVRRHLNPDGILILTTPNVFSAGNFKTIVRGILRRRPQINPEHAHWYCITTIVQLLRSHGFTVRQLRTIPRDRSSAFKQTLQAKFLPFASPAIFVVAEPIGVS